MCSTSELRWPQVPSRVKRALGPRLPLAALPLIFTAAQVKINVPRGRLGFYAYYPAHLTVLCGLARLL
jgi:hypothetical protein